MSFGFVWHEHRAALGTFAIGTATYELYVGQGTYADFTQASLATVLAAINELPTSGVGYDRRNVTVTPAVNGSQSQRRLPNQVWASINSGFTLRSVLVGHVASDTPAVYFDADVQKATTGGQVSLTIQNADWLANVQ